MHKFAFYLLSWVVHIPPEISAERTRNPLLVDVGLNGQPQPRIVNGEAVKPHEYPWLVSIKTQDLQICGGSVLNENFFVTAAHCMYEFARETITIISGDHNIVCHEGPERIHTVFDMFIHQDYIHSGVGRGLDDIAVVRVTPKFRLNKYVGRIGLPSSYFVHPGTAIVAGWGTMLFDTSHYPAMLRKAEVEKLDADHKDCAPFVHVGDRIACYKGKNKESACGGDSGGPVICMEGGDVVLCNIVSASVDCGTVGFINAYFKIKYYAGWIRERLSTSNPAAITYRSCGGLINHTSVIIDHEFDSGAQCDWVVYTPFNSKTINAQRTFLRTGDKLWFTPFSNSFICKGCEPVPYNRDKPIQRYLFDGPHPFTLITLRIAEGSIGNKRKINLQINSAGPRVYFDKERGQFQYYGLETGEIDYPQRPKNRKVPWYYNNREVWIMINPPIQPRQVLSVKWRSQDIDAAGDSDKCPGDHLSFYRLGDDGKFEEYRRDCGLGRPEDFDMPRKGITLLHFESTSESRFGRGFEITYEMKVP